MKFQREIEFTPAWDERHVDPQKDFGIGDVGIAWFVVAEQRAIQFTLATNWYLPDVQEDLNRKNQDHWMCGARARDLAYHSPVPMFEDQEAAGSIELDKEHPTIFNGEIIAPMSFVTTDKFTPCRFTGGRCYFGGSFIRAKLVYQLLLSKGSEEVWKFLEAEFIRTFEKFL